MISLKYDEQSLDPPRIQHYAYGMFQKIFLSIFCLISCLSTSYAIETEAPQTRGRITNLPLPRFVTLKGKKTNMRSGPGKEYGLLWVYQKKGLPVEIINEYDHWRRVRDLDGSEGWIHQSVLSGKRMIVFLEGTYDIYEEPDITSDVIAIVDGGTISRPRECQDNFCLIEHEKFSGWVQKTFIYGVYDHETFE